jgi:hypothetical protein
MNRNHVYDGDEYWECPHCAAVKREQARRADAPPPPPAPDPQPGAQTPRPARPHRRTEVLWGYEQTADPVVGWLVAIKGPAKGNDYKVRSGNNSIGRSPDQRIYIPEDTQIHSSHATITYDPVVFESGYEDTPAFFLMSNPNVTGLIRIRYPQSEDGQRWHLVNVPTPLPIDLYPIIWIGNTELMFVPFCGQQFYWNSRQKESER